MALEKADIERIEALLDRTVDVIVQRLLAGRREPAPAAPVSRLTPEQFAIAVELHIETVRLKIRTGEIPRHLVYGERPKKISPKALELFGVTPPEALARLAAHNLLPASLPSAA